jgi:heme/copper-type cytochrome/quinol oxidase subunit 1
VAVTEAGPHEIATGADTTDDTAPAGGLAALLGTVSHLTIGRLYLASAFVLLVVGRVAGILVDVERIDTSSTTVLDEFLGPAFSAHQLIDLFLFLLPAFVGLAIAVVPLQVGAATVAFPRAAAASFWTWLLSSGVVIAGYVIDGGPPGLGTDTDGILLWTVGLGGAVAALLVATVCVLTTVLALRTAGMTVDRVPMFTWGAFVAGMVWLVSLPVLVAGLVLTYVDVEYDAGLGAASHLGWAFGAPQVFAFALPALGLLLDVVPVAAGVRLRSRGTLLAFVGLAGVLSFGAELVAADESVYEDVLYVGAAFALLLPILAIGGGVADTLRRGRMRPIGPLVLALSAFVLLLAGVAANALRVIDNLDLVGTSADAAVRELAVVAGIAGVAGAAQYWATKLFGAQLKEVGGVFVALLLLLGGLAMGVADVWSGLLDQPDGVATAASVRDGVEALNVVALAGGVLVLVGVLLLLVNLAAGRGGGDGGDGADRGEVPPDPWDGQTLEWATASPPAPGGPGPLDPVTSATPLLDRKEA